MKTLLPAFFVLIFLTNSKAQTGGLQIGAVATFFGKQQNNYGGELIENFSIKKNISAGGGIQLLSFNAESNLYIPVFATFKLLLPANKIEYFFHIDPGYGIHNYNSSILFDGTNGSFQFDFKNTGGFYLGTGAGVRLKSKASPYINLQYSIYHFKYVATNTDLNELKEDVYTDKRFSTGITITAGIWLHANK
jgi:hypothetical protein